MECQVVASSEMVSIIFTVLLVLLGEAHLFHAGVRLVNMEELMEGLLVRSSVLSFWVCVTEVGLVSGEHDPYTRDVLVFGETVDIPIAFPRPSTVSNGLWLKHFKAGARLALIVLLILGLHMRTRKIRRPWRLLMISKMIIS